MVRRGSFLIIPWLSSLSCGGLGCGGLHATPWDAGADADATIDAAMDAPSNDGFGFIFGDVVPPPPPDAVSVDVYVVLDDGGSPFQCDNNVTCEGRTQYCDISSVGPPGGARCADLPDGCVPANCDCLPNANSGTGCSCEHAPTGDGLIAGCVLP